MGYSGSRMANGDSYSDFFCQRTLVPCDSKLFNDFVTLLLCSCCFVDLCIMWYQVQYRFQLFIRKRNPPVGASVHCTDVNMRYLDNQFGDRVHNQQEVSAGQGVDSSIPRPLPPRLLPLGLLEVQGVQPSPCHPQPAAGYHH